MLGALLRGGHLGAQAGVLPAVEAQGGQHVGGCRQPQGGRPPRCRPQLRHLPLQIRDLQSAAAIMSIRSRHRRSALMSPDWNTHSGASRGNKEAVRHFGRHRCSIAACSPTHGPHMGSRSFKQCNIPNALLVLPNGNFAEQVLNSDPSAAVERQQGRSSAVRTCSSLLACQSSCAGSTSLRNGPHRRFSLSCE